MRRHNKELNMCKERLTLRSISSNRLRSLINSSNTNNNRNSITNSLPRNSNNLCIRSTKGSMEVGRAIKITTNVER